MSYSEFESDFEAVEGEPLPPSELIQAIAPKLMSCRIREYVPEDLEACLEIYRSNSPEFLHPQGLERFEEFLNVGTSYILVLEYDGDIVACGGLELIGDSDSAALVNGMVHRDYHRRGFGTTLLAARIALLEPEERPLELWMRAGKNVLPFYGRFGFALQKVNQDRADLQRGVATFWLGLDAQDIADVRDALEDRSIRIYLNDLDEEEEELD